MRNKFLILTTSFLVVLGACKKDDDQSVNNKPNGKTHPEDTCLPTRILVVFPSTDDTNFTINTYNPDATLSNEANYYNGLNNQPAITYYEYDNKGRVIQAGYETYVYDLKDNLVLQKNSSVSIIFKYDDKNRLQERIQSGPSRFSSYFFYSYDEKDRVSIYRNTRSDTTNRSEWHLSYNSSGHLIKEEHYSVKDNIFTLYNTKEYEYNAKGSLITETSINAGNSAYNFIITYEYDEYDNVIKKTENYNGNISIKTYTRKYDDKGNQTYEELFNDGISNYHTIYEYTCWD